MLVGRSQFVIHGRFLLLFSHARCLFVLVKLPKDLTKPFLLSAQPHNKRIVNESVTDLFTEEEDHKTLDLLIEEGDYKSLRNAMQNYDNYDTVGLTARRSS